MWALISPCGQLIDYYASRQEAMAAADELQTDAIVVYREDI